MVFSSVWKIQGPTLSGGAGHRWERWPSSSRRNQINKATKFITCAAGVHLLRQANKEAATHGAPSRRRKRLDVERTRRAGGDRSTLSTRPCCGGRSLCIGFVTSKQTAARLHPVTRSSGRSRTSAAQEEVASRRLHAVPVAGKLISTDVATAGHRSSSGKTSGTA